MLKMDYLNNVMTTENKFRILYFEKGSDSGELCSWLINNIEIDHNLPDGDEDYDSSVHYTKTKKPYRLIIEEIN